MKKLLISSLLAVGIALINLSAGVAADLVYKCSNKQMGKFTIVFKGGRVFTDFDTLIDGKGTQAAYELKRDEDYEDEANYELYVYSTREGKAEFYFEGTFAAGGRQMKNGRGGGYIQIDISFRSGLRLPQQFGAVCFLPTK